ncbi:MAG: DUF2809 domain-containing protein [Polyangiaceae bacterium]
MTPASRSNAAPNRIRPRQLHAAISVVVLGVLTAIALGVHDRWIRPHGGDLLVMIWLHHTWRSLWPRWSRWKVAGAALLLALAVELGQLLRLLDRLGLEEIAALRVILGQTADGVDVAMYVVGALIAALTDPDRTGE